MYSDVGELVINNYNIIHAASVKEVFFSLESGPQRVMIQISTLSLQSVAATTSFTSPSCSAPDLSSVILQIAGYIGVSVSLVAMAATVFIFLFLECKINANVSKKKTSCYDA